MEKTIEIPEGYKVRIEGNKIIFEPEESEDERIKNFLIGKFREIGEVWHEYSTKDILAWLEKKNGKDYALKSFNDEDVHKFVQYIERQAKAYELNLPNRSYDIYGFAKDILSRLEKQGEPVVYDRDNYNSAKEKAWNCKSFSDDSSRKSIFLEGFQDGYQFGIHEEKPHRWTWHDEAVRKEAIACLEDWENQFPINSIDYRNVLNWLKNELTIHTEEKQGSQNLANSAKTCKDEQNLAWSEEDEKRFESTLHRMEIVGNGCAFGQLKDDIEWLKSLKERYTWKPSDEQIE